MQDDDDSELTDGERQIIRLLTEIRDAQQEELSFSRRAIDESLGLQRGGARAQKVALSILFCLICVLVLFVTLRALS